MVSLSGGRGGEDIRRIHQRAVQRGACLRVCSAYGDFHLVIHLKQSRRLKDCAHQGQRWALGGQQTHLVEEVHAHTHAQSHTGRTKSRMAACTLHKKHPPDEPIRRCAATKFRAPRVP